MGGVEAEPTWLCATTDGYDNRDGQGKHCSVAGMLGVEQSIVDAILGNKFVDFLKGKAWSTWRTFPGREQAPPAKEEIWIWVYPRTLVNKGVIDVIKLTCPQSIHADKKQLQKDYAHSGTQILKATASATKQRHRESLGNRQAEEEAANSFLPVSAHSQSTRYACTRETHANSTM